MPGHCFFHAVLPAAGDYRLSFGILVPMEIQKTNKPIRSDGRTEAAIKSTEPLDTIKLLDWYRHNKRDLPFRRQRDPYKIWISEIMSQQTRIEAMLGYYENFIQLWPDLPSLAMADEEKLHKAWQGLGYYSRARNLKKAAQICMDEYEGRLPKAKALLKKLPGIGDYTAGAIASIANNERCTAIDGNVIRVLSRFYWLEADFHKAAQKKKLEAILEKQLPSESDMPDFTQALMELGARICTTKKAECTICPLQKGCLGARQSNPLMLPLKKARMDRKTEEKQVVILAGQIDGKWALHLRKRPDSGLLAGLYEFDSSLADYESSHAGRANGLNGKELKNGPLLILERIDLGEYSHVFSHKIWKMTGELLIVPALDDFILLEDIEKNSAIPSAFMPFYKKAVQVLEAIETIMDPKAPDQNA